VSAASRAACVKRPSPTTPRKLKRGKPYTYKLEGGSLYANDSVGRRYAATVVRGRIVGGLVRIS